MNSPCKNSITPHNIRWKRKLINELGGIIEATSGNLDKNDSKIEISRSNQSKIIKYLNQELN